MAQDGYPQPAKESELHRYLRTLGERRWAVVFALVVGAGLYVAWAVRQVRIYSPGGIGLVVYTPGQTTIQPVVLPYAWLEIDMAAPAPVPSPNLVPGQR